MNTKYRSFSNKGYHPIRKIKVILAGLRFAILSDFSVAYKMVLSAIIIALALFFKQWVDFAMILLATGVVLTAELMNSAIEVLCDFLETGENEKIGAIKDIAAAAVGISIVVWLAVVVFDLIHLASVIRELIEGSPAL